MTPGPVDLRNATGCVELDVAVATVQSDAEEVREHHAYGSRDLSEARGGVGDTRLSRSLDDQEGASSNEEDVDGRRAQDER
jgi:hypothetical protein